MLPIAAVGADIGMADLIIQPGEPPDTIPSFVLRGKGLL